MGHPGGRPGNHDLQSRIENAPWLVMDASVDLVWFLGEPIAVQRRVVKAIGEHRGVRMPSLFGSVRCSGAVLLSLFFVETVI